MVSRHALHVAMASSGDGQAVQEMRTPGEDAWHAMRLKICSIGEGEWWTAVKALSDNGGYSAWLLAVLPKFSVQHSDSADFFREDVPELICF